MTSGAERRLNLVIMKAQFEDYDKVIEFCPLSMHYYYYNERGQVKATLGNYAEAIADYDKAIELNPKYAKAYHNRGLAKEALGQHDAAKVDFEKAKVLNSKGKTE